MDKQAKARKIVVYRDVTKDLTYRTVGAKVFDTDGNEVTQDSEYPPQPFEVGKYTGSRNEV